MLSNVTTQLRWLLDNIREVASCSNLKFGTVDSWLIYNLTGGDRDRVRINDAHSTGVRRESILAFFYQVSRNICNIAQNSGQNPRHRRHQRLAHHAHEPPDSRMGRQAPRILPSASERLACDQVLRRGIPVFLQEYAE